MIDVSLTERLIKAEKENEQLRNQQQSTQATLEYLSMMTDVDISTENDDTAKGNEAQ